MQKIKSKILKFLAAEDGPTAVEYAIMLALIVSVCFVSIQAVGGRASSMFDEIAEDVNTVATDPSGGF